MEEKKLTDEEIVKALECCVKNDCEKCPYIIKGFDCVISKQAENDFLDLIHRLQRENAEQKAEIERLTETLATAKQELVNEQRYYENAYSRACQLETQNAELQKQVDELTEENGYLKQCADTFLEDCKRERKQAVKDTAKKMYQDLKRYVILVDIPRGGEPAEEDCEAVLWWQIEDYLKKRGVEVE